MLTQLIELLLPVAKRFFPADPDKAQALAQEMAKARLQADVQLATAQLEINKAEAESPHLFVAGWRPFLGWALGFCLIWQAAGFQFAAFVATLIDPAYDVSKLPVIKENGATTSVLLGMLGLTGARTYERLAGKERNRL